MLEQVLDSNKLKELKSILEESKSVVLTCHMSPDGDAVGSTNAFGLLLRSMGKQTAVITPDQAPYDLAFVPGFNEMTAYTRNPIKAERLISSADLILCLDYNGLKRVAQMAPFIRQSNARKVLIDHHLHPEDFADLVISQPEQTSTCELVYRVFDQLGYMDLVDTPIAECLYTGMMTDTGNFSYNSNHADIYIIISELLKKGIDKDRIYTLAMNTSSEDRLRLLGYAMDQKMKVYPEAEGALITLSLEELKRYNYKKGDTESLVNMPLGIPTVRWSIFMREEEGYIKISARSKGDFAVNTICEQYFGGGGHKNASGGEFYGTLDEAVATFEKIAAEIASNKNDNETKQ